MRSWIGLFLLTSSIAGPAAAQVTQAELDAAAQAIEPRVIEWRRDLHAHPELSNRETRTAAMVAKQLRALGMEVRTGFGIHGVAGLLKGARPGRTVALRADMDALPVTEQTDVPFKSTVTTQFRGESQLGSRQPGLQQGRRHELDGRIEFPLEHLRRRERWRPARGGTTAS